FISRNIFSFCVLLGGLAWSAELVAKSGSSKGGGNREKVISREGRAKGGNSKTKIDFDDTDIGGARKTPMASMINNTKAKKDYDMVPIRTDWKPEMVQSASSLDAGRLK
ncbi:MAG: hypothetical protein NTV34_01635, partial [Proteobacteria bacterium]|nr:hypothetical protein [Pseudomonadota bacterium]